MNVLYTTAAALALTAGTAFAQAGYTSKAADDVPGAAVSSTGEMPSAESGATADMGTVASDAAAEPEATSGMDTNIVSTDPEQQSGDTDLATMETAETSGSE